MPLLAKGAAAEKESKGTFGNAKPVLTQQQPLQQNEQPAQGEVVAPHPGTAGAFPFHTRQLTHPPVHRGYLIASIILTSMALLFSVGSIAVEAIAVHRAVTDESVDEGGLLSVALCVLVFSLMMAESCFCFIAMLTCLVLLATKPYKVLIRSPRNGTFMCLCVSVFLLFLFAVYAVVLEILCAEWIPSYALDAGVSVLHCVRAAALLSFFAVLVANSKVLPHDECFEGDS